MTASDDLLNRAAAIAKDLTGPSGQIALDRVARRHLEFFDLAQERGLSWPQIAQTLHKAGAARKNGMPFTAGHLSAVIWRQRQKAAAIASIQPASTEHQRFKLAFRKRAGREDQDALRESKNATFDRMAATGLEASPSFSHDMEKKRREPQTRMSPIAPDAAEALRERM